MPGRSFQPSSGSGWCQIGALKRSGVIELATPCQIRIKDFSRLDAVAEAA